MRDPNQRTLGELRGRDYFPVRRYRVLNLSAVAAVDNPVGGPVEYLNPKHRLLGRRRNALDDPHLSIVYPRKRRHPAAIGLAREQRQLQVSLHYDALS